MYYTDLNIITAEHLLGNWEVSKKHVGNNLSSNIFSHINTIEIREIEFTAINGNVVEGNVTVFREKDIIYNPQIAFFVNAQKVANAIITRLLTQTENNREVNTLTLYFTNGLELTLLKKEIEKGISIWIA